MSEISETEAQYARWTSEHWERAESQGWNMFDYDGLGLWQLQRSDEAGVFETDGEAIDFVREMADRGDPTARLALDLDAFFEPLIYPEKAVTAGPRL